MTLPQTITLSSVYEGTTWEGIGQIIFRNSTTQQPINLENAQITMAWRRAGERATRLALTVGNGVQIINGPGGIFQIIPQVLALAAGLYYWEITVRLETGIVYAILIGTQEIVRVGL